MYKFIACFVAIDKDSKIKYVSHELTGARYPKNNTEDIVGMCRAIQSFSNLDLEYVDVFHLIDPAGRTIWEEGTLEGERDDLSIVPVDYS